MPPKPEPGGGLIRVVVPPGGAKDWKGKVGPKGAVVAASTGLAAGCFLRPHPDGLTKDPWDRSDHGVVIWVWCGPDGEPLLDPDRKPSGWWAYWDGVGWWYLRWRDCGCSFFIDTSVSSSHPGVGEWKVISNSAIEPAPVLELATPEQQVRPPPTLPPPIPAHGGCPRLDRSHQVGAAPRRLAAPTPRARAASRFCNAILDLLRAI